MIMSLKVIPNSRRADIEKLSESSYRIKVDAPATEGKANERLMEMLSECFNVPKSSIKIIKGHRNKNKLVEIKLNAREF